MTETPTEQLRQIEEEYERKRAEIERGISGQSGESAEQAPTPSEHETLSEVVEGEIQKHIPEFKASSHQSKSSDSLPPEAQEQVQGWVAITFSQGINEGVKAAKVSDDIALVDAFHNALTGNLYQALVEQGKITVVK